MSGIKRIFSPRDSDDEGSINSDFDNSSIQLNEKDASHNSSRELVKKDSRNNVIEQDQSLNSNSEKNPTPQNQFPIKVEIQNQDSRIPNCSINEYRIEQNRIFKIEKYESSNEKKEQDHSQIKLKRSNPNCNKKIAVKLCNKKKYGDNLTCQPKIKKQNIHENNLSNTKDHFCINDKVLKQYEDYLKTGLYMIKEPQNDFRKMIDKNENDLSGLENCMHLKIIKEKINKNFKDIEIVDEIFLRYMVLDICFNKNPRFEMMC